MSWLGEKLKVYWTWRNEIRYLFFGGYDNATHIIIWCKIRSWLLTGFGICGIGLTGVLTVSIFCPSLGLVFHMDGITSLLFALNPWAILGTLSVGVAMLCISSHNFARGVFFIDAFRTKEKAELQKILWNDYGAGFLHTCECQDSFDKVRAYFLELNATVCEASSDSEEPSSDADETPFADEHGSGSDSE